MGIKRKLDTEKLLHWAFRDELPKGYGRDPNSLSLISPMFRLADLGTRVDDWSSEPGFPRAMGEAPHPDALKVEAAAGRLQDLSFAGDAWPALRPKVMGDLDAYAPADHPALASMKFQVAAIVMLHARMGTRPRWDIGTPVLTRVNGKNGKPRVQYLDEASGELIDGLTSGRRYGPMARCPLQLDPPGPEIAAARAEYLVWRHGVQQVKETLESWGMQEHEALHPAAPVLPWVRDNEAKTRILPALQETIYQDNRMLKRPA